MSILGIDHLEEALRSVYGIKMLRNLILRMLKMQVESTITKKLKDEFDRFEKFIRDQHIAEGFISAQ
jgi:ribosomal protein S13